MKKLRKTISVITCTALVFASLNLTGCGTTPATNSGATASGEKTEGIKLVYANHQLAESAGSDETIQAMIDEYLRINTMGVTEIEIVNPGTEYSVFYQTQFMGGTQPDVGSGLMGQIHEYYANGQVLDMTPYFAQKTPYVGDGSLTWEESMSDNLLIQVQTADGANPCIPYAIGANKLVYNPDLLEKYGVEPPETWAEFMDVCIKIEEQGGTPIAYGGMSSSGGNLHWAMRVIMDSVASKELEAMDTDGSFFVDLSEFCEAVDSGKVDLSQEPWLSTYTLLDDYSQHWYDGATAMDSTMAMEKFAKGETAFMHCAIWMLQNLIENPERTFDLEVVRMPAITTETSPYGDGLYHNLGGLPNANYWVSSTLEGDKLAAAVDLCMFLTGEYCSALLADGMMMIPVLNPDYMPETEGPVGLFGLDYEISRLALYDATLGTEFFDAIYTDVQPMINGTISPQQAAEAQQHSLLTAVEKIKSDNGWSAENNYGRG